MRWLRGWIRRHSWALASSAMLALVWFTTTAQFMPTTKTNSVISSLEPPSTSARHPFSDAEYLAPRRFAPKGGVVFCLVGGDSTALSHFVALSDSMYAGLGVWGTDSSHASGHRIKASVFVPPTAMGSGRIMSSTRLQSLRGREADFEVGLTGTSTQRLSPKGLNSSRGRVSYGGVTGMKAEFIRTFLDGMQDSLVVWGMPAARSLAYPDYRYQAALTPFLKEQGFFQALTFSPSMNWLQAQYDAFETFAQHGTHAHYPIKAFNLMGHDRWSGTHMIGEGVDSYGLGGRRWSTSTTAAYANDLNASNATTVDSLTALIDLGAFTSSIVCVRFDGRLDDSTAASTGFNDIKYAALRTVMSHVAHRMDEGVLESHTFEQMATRVRGIRSGTLLNHYGFRRMSADSTGRAGAVASQLKYANLTPATAHQNYPMGFPPSIEWRASSADTIGPPNTAGSQLACVFTLGGQDTVTGAFNVSGFATVDSLTYGTASPLGNILLQTGASANPARSRPVTTTIPTMGCDARLLLVSAQIMVLNLTSGQFSGDSLLVGIKAGQFAQNWGDQMNQGHSSMGIMNDLLGGVNTAPDSLGLDSNPAMSRLLLDKQSIWPLFYEALVRADTTAYRDLLYSAATSAPMSWFQSLQARSMSRLLPTVIFGTEGGSNTNWDMVSTIGNPRSLTVPGGSPDDRFQDNTEQIRETAKVYNFWYYVNIDQMTDYVWLSLQVSQYVGPTSAAPAFGWLNIDVQTVP